MRPKGAQWDRSVHGFITRSKEVVCVNKVIWLMLGALPLISGCTSDVSERISKLEEKMESAESRIEFCETRIDSYESNKYEIGKVRDIIGSGYGELDSGKEEQFATDAAVILPAASAAGNMTAEDIQRALKNANFYNGPIDGKIGPNTLKAIIEFQKANSLKADGIAGQKTKALLVKYLSQETD